MTSVICFILKLPANYSSICNIEILISISLLQIVRRLSQKFNDRNKEYPVGVYKHQLKLCMSF